MSEPVFLVSLGECELTVEQVWPDGGAPENPTAADVADVMRTYGPPTRVASDWCLLDEIEVFGLHDKSRATVR